MSDRTDYCLELPRSISDVALLAVANAFLGGSWSPTLADLRPLRDDEAVVVVREEVPLGSCEELAALILQALEGSHERLPFNLWEVPSYEFIGIGYRWHPDLGLFKGPADGEGNTVLLASAAQRVLEGGISSEAFQAWVSERLALAWPDRSALARM